MAKIDASLLPMLLDHVDYNVRFTIAQYSTTPHLLEDKSLYDIMVQWATKAKSPKVKLVVEELADSPNRTEVDVDVSGVAPDHSHQKSKSTRVHGAASDAEDKPTEQPVKKKQKTQV